MTTHAVKIKRCRVCGNPRLLPAVDIGEQYLSSIFPEHLNYRGELKKYPMDLVLCDKQGSEDYCGLLQLGHELDLSGMYDAYPYTSSSNSSMKAILQDVMNSGVELKHLRPWDAVLDIGCNDGTLLSFFKELPYKLIGIDAAKNVKPVFSAMHLTMKKGFFNKQLFEEISDKKAKLIFSIAMFYHLSDPITFSKDAAACLDPEGAWIIQMAYLPAMVKTNMYDNVVHEHVGYYGIETLQWVMNRAGLEIFDVLLNDVYGGSFRAFVRPKGSTRFPVTERYHKLLEEERRGRYFDIQTYQEFDRRIRKTREDLTQLIRRLKADGKKVWVYGASTKGNTILQYCGLGRDVLEAAADANSFKFGKYIIGSDIPIKDEKTMREAKPDYLLALPYSFARAFADREVELVKKGAKFIVPLPEVHLIP
jgi:SAM-dependent methyltransferase